MMMPPTIMIGAETSIVRPMLVTICTWVTSLVVREISVGAPNFVTSCAEKVPTRSNSDWRRSRPISAEDRAPR